MYALRIRMKLLIDFELGWNLRISMFSCHVSLFTRWHLHSSLPLNLSLPINFTSRNLESEISFLSVFAVFILNRPRSIKLFASYFIMQLFIHTAKTCPNETHAVYVEFHFGRINNEWCQFMYLFASLLISHIFRISVLSISGLMRI